MIHFPFILPSFLVFTAWLSYELKKAEKKNKKGLKDFLETETLANNTRKQDISDLDFVLFDASSLPEYDGSNKELLAQQKKLLSFEGKQLLNLSAYSNTELKLKYGAANLEVLSTADVNFINFSRELLKYGELLYQEGLKDQALFVLEYGIEIGTDLSRHYSLLADLYEETQDLSKLISLKEKAEQIHTLMKDSIVEDLNQRIALLETILPLNFSMLKNDGIN